VYHTNSISRTGIRKVFTIVGKSDRVYIQLEMFKQRKDPRLNTLKAEYDIDISHLDYRSTKAIINP
jgi:hypothetical protein